MNATKFIKPEKLVAYFDQEIRESLLANELYDIESYGWLDAYTVDPDYCGYAEWVDNPRIAFDHDAFWKGQPFSTILENSDIGMMAAGHDFMETMKGAYLMLGQALFFAKHENESNNATYGSVSLVGAVNQLNIASDRIRDYYAYAIEKKSFDDYKQRNLKISRRQKEKSRKNNVNFQSEPINYNYSQFFHYALNTLDSKIFSLANSAALLADNLEQEHRKGRNEMVHQLASYYAKMHEVFYSQQLEPLAIVKHVKEFSEEIPANIAWYKKLVELGNLVFLIESRTRN